MDPRADISEFLVSRRARITPEQAGLPAFGTNRRVAGLRREEVAMLAGISAEYYVRLERGGLRGVSEDVLDGIAPALQLDEADRMHLFHLARAANARPHRRTGRRPTQERVRPVVQRILDALVGVPAFVENDRLDVLASNTLGEAFYAPQFGDPVPPINGARFVFLNPRAKEFFVDWDTIAGDCVGILRAEAGRDPYDKRLSDLIGELSTRSDEFRVRWAAHDVKLHRTGVKRFRHPVVGALTLEFERLELPGDPARRCSSTHPNRARRHTRRCSSWPAGRRHRRTPLPIGGRDGAHRGAAGRRGAVRLVHGRRVDRPHRPGAGGVGAQRRRGPLRIRRPHRLARPRSWADAVRHGRSRAGPIPWRARGGHPARRRDRHARRGVAPARCLSEPPHGPSLHHRGRRRVGRSRHIVLTFEFEGMPGHVCLETHSFSPVDDGRRTAVTQHAVFPSAADRNGMAQSGMEAHAPVAMAQLQAVAQRLSS